MELNGNLPAPNFALIIGTDALTSLSTGERKTNHLCQEQCA